MAGWPANTQKTQFRRDDVMARENMSAAAHGPANDEAPAVDGRPIRTAKALRDAARAHSRTAIEALAAVARDEKNGASRISAANAILDRAFGKTRAEPEAAEPVRELPERRLIPVLVDPRAPIDE
jgi:hypothetical protein